MKLCAPTKTPIAIDTGTRWFKAVQMRMRGVSHPRICAAARLPRTRPGEPVTPDEVEGLMGMLGRQGFEGREVALVLPASRVLVSVMELPPKGSGAPLEQIGRAEMARTHRLEPGQLEMAWWELPGGVRAAEGTHVMGVGCEGAVAGEFLDPFERGGAIPVCLDTPLTALGRAGAQALPPGDKVGGVLEIGWTCSTLVVFDRGRVLFERTLGDSGLSSVHARLSTQLGIDAEAADALLNTFGIGGPTPGRERLADVAHEIRPVLSEFLSGIAGELRTSLAYASRRYSLPVPGLRLTGCGAELPGVASRLATEAEVACSVLRPTDVAPCVPTVAGVGSPKLMIAVGAASQHACGLEAAA